MDKSIEIKNIVKSIGGSTILRDVSFEAREGRVTAFLGPNGAGKSSTLRILLGLDRATSGEAKIGGRLYKDYARPLLSVGASFDGVGAPGDRTVYRHLRIIAASNGIDRARIEEVLQETDILQKKNSSIGSLSLGEGQRLGAYWL